MFFQLIQQYNVQKLSLRFLFLWDAVEAQAKKKKNYNSHASIMLRLNVCDCRSSSNVKDFTNLNLKAYVLPRHFSSVVKTQKINVTFFFLRKK